MSEVKIKDLALYGSLHIYEFLRWLHKFSKRNILLLAPFVSIIIYDCLLSVS